MIVSSLAPLVLRHGKARFHMAGLKTCLGDLAEFIGDNAFIDGVQEICNTDELWAEDA